MFGVSSGIALFGTQRGEAKRKQSITLLVAEGYDMDMVSGSVLPRFRFRLQDEHYFEVAFALVCLNVAFAIAMNEANQVERTRIGADLHQVSNRMSGLDSCNAR